MADLPPVVAAAPADARFGKFVRVVRLGVGAYGEVWKAWDTELSRWVALKFLKQEGGEELARFLREARTAASLSHANIAAIYEIGEAQGHHYIAMQFVDGRTLRGFPRGDRRRIVTIVRDAAIAIEAAHDRAIVHRDLKPDNLMVDAAGRVYVMDFGLARPVEKGSGMTASGMAVGTPAYMSPEQARGDVAEERSDVYGLGATLYDLLAGRPPFDGANLVDLLMAVVEREPVAPRRLDPALEPELETIVLKTLEKDPAKRYPSMRALRDDLDRWLRGEPIEAQPLSTIAKFARGGRRSRCRWPERCFCS
jgi:serine/threonine-protein kinase